MNRSFSKIYNYKLLIFSGIFLFLIYISFPVSAKDRFYPDKVWGNVSGWLIYWNNLKTSCVASGKYHDGTIFWMGRGGGNGKHKFIAFANKNWTGIKEFKDYRFNVVFNGRRNWKGNFYGIKVESVGISGFEVQGLNNRFFNEIARATNVVFYIGQKRIMKLRLKGTSRAIKSLYKCDNQIARSKKIDFGGLAAENNKSDQMNAKIPKSIEELTDEWADYWENCRGGNFELAETKKACNEQLRMEKQLSDLGYCYGHKSDKATTEYDWHKCRKGSFKAQ